MTAASRLAKLARLGAAEWRLLLAALFLLPATALALRLFDYHRTRAWLGRHARGRCPPPDAEAEARRVARMVSVAACHGPYRANCLRQALVAWWLLARRGIDAELVIGVNKDAQGFAAHAWVERQGRVLIGGTDSAQRFQPMREHR